jgi:hypothetical protein
VRRQGLIKAGGKTCFTLTISSIHKLITTGSDSIPTDRSRISSCRHSAVPNVKRSDMLAQRVVPVVARNAILDATRSVGVCPQCARLEEADVVVDVLAGIARFAGAGPVTAAIARKKKKKVESELNGIGGGRRNDMTYKI